LKPMGTRVMADGTATGSRRLVGVLLRCRGCTKEQGPGRDAVGTVLDRGAQCSITRRYC
jgi:hypothetical protein